MAVRAGRIAAIDTGRSRLAAAEDLDGDLLLPGLVELHTDHLERHLMPRPGVLWPCPLAAMAAHDAQMVAGGVTTVFNAIAVGDHRGVGGDRRALLAHAMEAVRTARAEGLARADHHVHLRCEVGDPDVLALFDAHAGDPAVRLVSLMDHTPGQRQWGDLSVYRGMLAGEGGGADVDADADAVIRARRAAQARHAAAHRHALAARCRALGLPLASHDDATPAHVAEAVRDGAAIAEFPTTRAAAEAARAAGLAVVMGAPNLVRGDSHSGNVPAAELAAAGLVDVLSSDYVPASLLPAAFLLNERLGVPLPAAVAAVSAVPAALLGLGDRGAIAPGRRADLLRVRRVRGRPLVRSVWCAGTRML